MRTKLVLGLLFAVAALLVAVMPASATKSSHLAPQEANIPYLAWNGENVKLVRSFDWGRDFPSIADHSSFAAEFAVVEWTGDPNYKPYIIGGTLDASTNHFGGDFLRPNDSGLTASGVVVDTHPGIAKIKLFVTHDHQVVKEQVFEVAWMSIVDPSIHEMSQADLAALSNDPMTLGDPAGDGKFVPMPTHKDGRSDLLTSRHHDTTVNDFGLGLVQVKVKGTFPFPGGALTMPDDWAKLASDPVFGAMTQDGPDPLAWDIHGHAINHHWTDIESVLWGGSMKIGPFDPVAEWVGQTMFPDGTLDALDAPMPADRVDFAITNAGGVGTFATAEKEDIYVQSGTREWDGNAFVASQAFGHSWEFLYAPFYKTYIPATSRPGGGSGIDAADYAGNFPPFLVHRNPYEFWTLLNQRVSDARAHADANVCKDELGDIRPSPSDRPATDTVSVYTDEHGEAIVAYDPDAGFYYPVDSNNRCDLGDGSNPVLLGTATVQATAIYPYEQAAGGSVTIGTVTKQVYGLPMKALSFTAKSHNEAIVTETIHDIYGNPVVGAPVKFSVDPTGPRLLMEQLPCSTDPKKDQTCSTVVDQDTGWITLTTDWNGKAAIDVIASQGVVNVLAENLGTQVKGAGVLRDMRIDFSGSMPKIAGPTQPIVTTPTTTTTVVSGGTTTTNVTTNVTTTSPAVTTQVTTTTNVVSPSGKTAAVSGKVVTAKLVGDAKFVYVKVTSAAKTLTIKVKLLGKNGKLIRTVNVSVPTNKLLKLGLKVPKTARAVTAGVVR